VAATAGAAKSRIAHSILISSYNLQIPRMFAALFLTTGLGVLIFVSLSALSDLILSKWHESAVKDEN
jgi:NitT/TauT family transport system permease protein